MLIREGPHEFGTHLVYKETLLIQLNIFVILIDDADHEAISRPATLGTKCENANRANKERLHAWKRVNRPTSAARPHPRL